MKHPKPGKKNSSNSRTVTIIAPIMHFGRDSKEFLQSINHLDYPKNKLKTIIIVNSDEKIPDYFIKNFPLVSFLEPKQNLGFSRAINQGIEKSNSQYLFLGNEDLVMSPQSL